MLLSLRYPHEQHKATSLYQTFKLVGLCSGPFLGGHLYSALGYQASFILVGLLNATKLVALRSYETSSLPHQEEYSLTSCHLISRVQTLFSFMNCYVFYSLVEDLEPVLPGKLKRDYGFDTEKVGNYFLAQLLSAVLIAIVVTFCVRLKDSRYWIVSGGTLSAICHLLVGPSKLFGFPN